MPSAAIYDAAIAFLESDIITGINAEQSGLMVAGSVTTARRGDARPRRDKQYPASVEIVPADERPARMDGLGWELVELAFDLRCSLRRKSKSEGKDQLDVVEDMARSLERRYRGVSNLTINPAGATFRHSWAQLTAVDTTPEKSEWTHAVVRLSLRFSEAQAAT